MELKRLRLSRQGFDVLDERGRVLLQESGFSLSDASDSFRRDAESRADYLEKTFWFGLRGLLDTGAVGTTPGFLEYYGFYYLVSDYGSDDGIVLIPLGMYPEDRGTIPFDKFCEKAWEFTVMLRTPPKRFTAATGLTYRSYHDCQYRW